MQEERTTGAPELRSPEQVQADIEFLRTIRTCPLCGELVRDCVCDPERSEVDDDQVEAMLEREGLPEAWDLPGGWAD
jgi:hypothetical protein